MRISIVTPAPPRTTHGNRNTALRWSRILRGLGHRVSVQQEYRSEPTDCLIALHARRSAESIVRFRSVRPDAPLIVALTGTDLYGDLPRGDESALHSLELATRVVVLHDPPRDGLPEKIWPKVAVIYQSAVPPRRRAKPLNDRFEVGVVGHLREVKDPFLTARAVEGLPGDSQISVLHMGMAMSPQIGQASARFDEKNPRYHWVGDLPHWKTLRLMSRCRLLVVSSIMEGGPTVLTEALAMELPCLSTRIPGVVGMLGANYPGYFSVGDATALRKMLLRAETEPAYYQSLLAGTRDKAWIAEPAREQASWQELLNKLEIG